MLHTLLIAAAVLGGIAALVALLIFITRRQQRQRRQMLRESLRKLIQQEGLNPDLTEEFNHRMLAIDSKSRMLLFVQADEDSPQQVLDLTAYSDCRLWKECRGVSYTGSQTFSGSQEQVSAIGLVFVRRNDELVKLPFYTEILDGIGERQALQQAATAWLQRIKALREAKALA